MGTAGGNCQLFEPQFEVIALQVNVSGDNVFVAKLSQLGAHRLAVQKGQNH